MKKHIIALIKGRYELKVVERLLLQEEYMYLKKDMRLWYMIKMVLGKILMVKKEV